MINYILFVRLVNQHDNKRYGTKETEQTNNNTLGKCR